MKLADIREPYNFNTGKASDLARQLCLAGVVVAWLFKFDRPGGAIGLATPLMWAVALFVLALIFDLAQYAYVSGALGLYNDRLVAAGTVDQDEIKPHRRINYATRFFFWSKIGLAILGHAILLSFIASKIVG